ncbi:MAG: Mut7-C ubiquitin/RNAse domain-containing protein [Kiritimatiellales bacterium]|nr:Mut7-C ubiquitin/RNAse domain-containing protein [Kiritimatiellales bacterium]
MKAHEAQFRFYEELNDFLPRLKRKKEVAYAFNGNPAVKDSIEAQGIPHTEVDLIVVNGESVGFGYQLREGDRVAVYPVFESIDISPIVKLRDEPLRRTAFVLDVHLGKLARILRMLGFDANYRNDYNDDEIIRISLDEHRIILTRDRCMLFNRVITHALYLHSTRAEKQAQEVLARFDLYTQTLLFRRCPLCNGLIEPVGKETILDRLEPLTIQYYHEFFQCLECGQIYWRGTHYGNILRKLEQITGFYLDDSDG